MARSKNKKDSAETEQASQKEGAGARSGLWSRLFGKGNKENIKESEFVDHGASAEAADVACDVAPATTGKPDATMANTGASHLQEPNKQGAEVTETEVAPRQIEDVARAIWIKEGCPEGRAEEHWYQAERELRRGQSRESR